MCGEVALPSYEVLLLFSIGQRYGVFRIVSTFHSGVLSIMSGGGSKKFGPCSEVSLYGVKRDAWKTL
jgi:hypothetical protein